MVGFPFWLHEHQMFLISFMIHKYVSLKPIGHYNFKKHLKAVAIFFAMSCATTIYTHLDTVMLGFMTTDTDVGYYNAAVKIKSILVSIVTSLGVVLYRVHLIMLNMDSGRVLSDN